MAETREIRLPDGQMIRMPADWTPQQVKEAMVTIWPKIGWTKEINAAAQEYGLDPDFLRAVMWTESGADPGAVSPKGAAGLMQFMPGTWKKYGGGADPSDPSANINAGAWYLHDLLQEHGGNEFKALSAYSGNPLRPMASRRKYYNAVRQRYDALPDITPSEEQVYAEPGAAPVVPGAEKPQPWWAGVPAEQAEGAAAMPLQPGHAPARQKIGPTASTIGAMPGQPIPSSLRRLFERPETALPMLGAMAAAPFTGGASFLTTLGAVGLGAATGEAARQGIEHIRGEGPKTSEEAARRIGTEFLLGAGGEVLPKALAGRITPEGAAAKLMAREHKLPIPATRFREGLGPRMMEGAIGLTPTGRGVQKAYQGRLVKRMTGIVEDLERAVAPPGWSREDIGLALGKALDEAKDFNSVYAPLNAALSGKPTLTMSEMYKYVQSHGGKKLIGKLGMGGTKNMEGQVLRALIDNEGAIAGQDVSLMLSKIWKKHGLQPATIQNLREGLKKAMVRDLSRLELGSWLTPGRYMPKPALMEMADAGARRAAVLDRLGGRAEIEAIERFGAKFKDLDDEIIGRWAQLLDEREAARAAGSVKPYTVADAKTAADRVYAETMNWFKGNEAAKEITAKMRFGDAKYFEQYPDRVLTKLFQNGRIEDLAGIRQLLHKRGRKEIFDVALAKHLETEIAGAFTQSAATGRRVLQPYKLYEIYLKNEALLRQLAPGVLRRFRPVAMAAKTAAPEFEAAGKGLLSADVLGTGGLTWLLGGKEALVAANVTAPLLAWALVGQGALKRAMRALPGMAYRGAVIGGGTLYINPGGLGP